MPRSGTDRAVCEQAVAKGARLLDRRYPGWECRIDTEMLNIGNSTNCICGQLYGEYNKGVEALGIPDVDGEFGFSQPPGVSGALDTYWRLLNEIWIGSIQARIAKVKTRRLRATA
jgi:hypothetical protein